MGNTSIPHALERGASGEMSPALNAHALGLLIDEPESTSSGSELYVECAPGTPLNVEEEQDQDDGMKLAIIDEKEDSMEPIGPLDDLDRMGSTSVGLLIDAHAKDTSKSPKRDQANGRAISSPIMGAMLKLRRSISSSQKMKSIPQDSVSDSDENALSE